MMNDEPTIDDDVIAEAMAMLEGGDLPTEEISVEPEAPAHSFSLQFELEYLAAGARQATFDVLREELKSRKLTFTEQHFSRFCHYASVEHYVDELLEFMGNKKLSATKLIDDINSGVATQMATKVGSIDPTLAKLIDTAREKDMVVAALTSMPKTVYKGFVTKLGLEDLGVRIFSFTDADQYFPRADSWLKVCKEIEVSPRNSVALVTTSVACKGALTAGMRCVAVPDQFTNFQDFGGAYSVVDQLEDIEFDDVFSIIPDEEE